MLDAGNLYFLVIQTYYVLFKLDKYLAVYIHYKISFASNINVLHYCIYCKFPHSFTYVRRELAQWYIISVVSSIIGLVSNPNRVFQMMTLKDG